jgi:hypothetical protein
MPLSNVRGEEPKKGLLERLVGWVSWKTLLGVIAALWVAPQLSNLIQSRSDARDLRAQIAQDIEDAQGDAGSAAVFRAYDLQQRSLVGLLKFNDDGKLGEPPTPIPDRQAFNRTYRNWLNLDRKDGRSWKLTFRGTRSLKMLTGGKPTPLALGT